jgi:hypothetical protein
MHIDFHGMLPASKVCDHPAVTWEINEPTGKTFILVSVACKKCPASVNNVKIEKS